MGTPDFAVPALKKLIEAGHEVVAVVTQPDRAVGRSGELRPCPVKTCALSYDLPVLQPERIKRAEAVEELKKYPADIFVVAAFGQILSEEILHMPKYGCINIHASLLPKYRGAAPIQWAVINGDETAGVTIMRMEKGLDTGDMLAVKEIALKPKETGESLFDTLSELGAQLLIETLPGIEAGEIVPVKQDDEKSTYARMLTKEDGRIDWSKPAKEIECLIRGCNSWPSAYTGYGKKTLKIWDADVCADDTEAGNNVGTAAKSENDGGAAAESGSNGVTVGTVISVNNDSFTVLCGGQTLLSVKEVQLEGKRRMTSGEFLRGCRIAAGESFS